MNRNHAGYTLIEILTVLGLVVVILGIVFASIATTRSRSRDAQVRADKQVLILGLVRVKEANQDNQYPITSGQGLCLKSSGTCWRSTYSGNATLVNAVTPYMPGGVIPQPPGTQSGQYRHDAYVLYRPASTFAGYPANSTFLIWPQEKQIQASDCDGQVSELDTGVWYCYEKLP